MSEKCKQCDKDLGVTRWGGCGQYCSERCNDIASVVRDKKAKDIRDKKEKFEEIKQMAWEIYKNTCFNYDYEKQPGIYRDIPLFDQCWNLAANFYEHAKAREPEDIE